jgi:cobalt-zinc-cadmium efflux system outer membrane protein
MRPSVLAFCCLVSPLLRPLPARAEGDALDSKDEAQLARAAGAATLLRLALARNPGLAENRARAQAAEARSHAASRLPDPELKYEQWGVPLARPVALGRADTLMVGLRQTFPAWGTLEARGRAAAEEAGSARTATESRRQDLAAQVLRTFATYYRTDQEVRLHREHLDLTSRVLELARLNQRTGHGALPDVLRLELELTRLHADLARIERERRSSRALLNALMDRDVDAPLGPPEDLTLTTAGQPAEPEKTVDDRRGEIDSARRAVRRTRANLDEVRRAASIPSVMVGVDYWYLPMGTEVRHAYGAMVTVNLPWLSGRRRDEVEEAEHDLRAEEQALRSARNTVHYELRDAAARVESARQAFTAIDQELVAQAGRSLEATQAAYAAGRGDAMALLDALRSSLEVRLERVRALAELASSQADLERAAGTLPTEGSRR